MNRHVRGVQRVTRAFNQPRGSVLVRVGGFDTRELSVDELSALLDRGLLGRLSPLARMCEATYLDLSDPSITHGVPSEWRRYSALDEFLTEVERDGVALTRGLRIDVWQRNRGGGAQPARPEFVIAFRGTRYTSLGDWFANLRVITRLLPGLTDHYERARTVVPHLVSHIQEQFGASVNVTACGHSMGGGLAQFAAYASPHIDQSIVFASSPIISKTLIDQPARDANAKDTLAVRVYEKGEILAAFRYLATLLMPVSKSNPKVIELRFNFNADGDPIEDHSIASLALQLEQNLEDGPRSV